jgi:putative hemolysin
MGVAAASVALLLIVSALLTASYEAATQISPSHVRTLQEEGFDGAAALASVRADEGTLRAGVRLLTAALRLGALSVIVLSGVSTWGRAGPVISALLGVVIVVLAADLLPHIAATRRPVRLALSSAPLLQSMARVTRPMLSPLTRLEGRSGGSDEAHTNGLRELREIQEIGEEEGVLERSETRLVERAFRLDELTAWDVMVPRVDIFAWRQELTLADIVGSLSEVPYSRVPIYEGSVDDVTGIVYVREAYEHIAQGDHTITLRAIAREPFFVPGSLSLTQLLEAFQLRRIHLGIVADEFGGTDGLVTLEDILEELVGEIHDETDVTPEEIVRVSEHVVECNASVDVRDLQDVLRISFPKAEHRSLNGFILDELGHVPAEGESFERNGARFEILAATETQVVRARVTNLDQHAGDG